jgi:hypothetical protein
MLSVVRVPVDPVKFLFGQLERLLIPCGGMGCQAIERVRLLVGTLYGP